MHKIKIGSKTWKFKTSFGEFTCSNIKDYMNIHKTMDDVREKYNAEVNSIKPLENSFIQQLDYEESKKIKGLISDAIDNCASLQMQIHLIRVDLLSALCYSSSFKDWALSTKGVDKETIDTCLKYIFEKLGNFNDFWNSTPIVEKFSLGSSFGASLFKTKYQVHEMDSTSLIREAISQNILNRAMNERSKLDQGYFDDLVKFVATIVRPASQKEEISFSSKAFIKGKNVKGLSYSEKLTYYTEKLEEATLKRMKQFENMPLSIAIGVILCYFQKKNLYEKNMKKYTKEGKPQ